MTSCRAMPGLSQSDRPVWSIRSSWSGLAQLREDIPRGGRVQEAREAVKELEASWPDDHRVQYWARVLAPPRVIPTPEEHRNRRPLDRERAWLKEHAREYPGRWLAVYEDR